MDIFKDERNTIYTDMEGNIEAIQVQGPHSIKTAAGILTPIYFVEDHGRKKLSPIKLFKDKQIKTLSLQNPTPIKTSIGTFSAELVTFYNSGAIRRLFPLNGKLSGYWSEASEYKLAQTLSIPTSIGAIEVKPINLHFYETGELKSITFWPGERVKISTPIGEFVIRQGISFYKNGMISSFEPAAPVKVETPIGLIEAYDSDPNGMNGDNNSLSFMEEGQIAGISTISDMVSTISREGENLSFTPKVIRSMCDDTAFSLQPLKIFFKEDFIQFKNGFSQLGKVESTCMFKTEKFKTPMSIAPAACGC